MKKKITTENLWELPPVCVKVLGIDKDGTHYNGRAFKMSEEIESLNDENESLREQIDQMEEIISEVKSLVN